MTLTSSNQELNEGFKWAKERALDLVITGEEDYTETAFWGSYAHDKMYCIRDITHQSEAGALLNLGDENFYMMRQFAKSTKDPNTSQKDWVSWKFDFYGNSSRFTRELPSPFDAVQRCYENYLWSGDDRWINDQELLDFYDLTMDYTVDLYDRTPRPNEPQFNVPVDASLLGNGVVGITEGQNGLASYHEFQNEKLYEAGDAFGSQYQATIAYSKILEARGETSKAADYAAKAVELKNHFETNWYSESERRYIRGFEPNGNAQTNWGHENSFFMVLKKLIEQGTDKGQDYIDFVHVSTMNKMINMEAQTYYAEAFYNNEQNHLGWHWLHQILNSRNIYPEVAFMGVYNTVGGMMGVRPNAPENKIYTISRLTKAVDWAEVTDVPVGNTKMIIRHEGNNKSQVTVTSGSDITWVAQFKGTYPKLMIDGVETTAQHGMLNGYAISYVEVPLTNATTKIISVPTQPATDFVYISNMTPESGNFFNETNSEYEIMMVRDDYFTSGISTLNGEEVVYNVTGNSMFKAKIGVDRANGGEMTFKVINADTDDVLFTSDRFTEQDNFKSITVDIRGVNKLKLVANGSGGNVSAIWADAGVAKAENADLILEYVSMSDAAGNNDGLVDPGETITITVKVTNSGVAASGDTKLNCEVFDPAYISTPAELTIGSLAVGESVEKTMTFDIDANTPRQRPLEFKFIANDGSVEGEATETFTTPYPIFNNKYDGLGNETASDGQLSAGETADLNLSVENTGNGISQDITVTVDVLHGSEYVTISSDETSKNIGKVGVGETINYHHTIKIDDDAPGGEEIKFRFILDDGIDKHEITKQYWLTKPQFEIGFVKLKNSVNEFPMIANGATMTYTLSVLNNGNGPSGENTKINIRSNEAVIETGVFNVGSLLADELVEREVKFTLRDGTSKDDVVKFYITVDDGTYDKRKTKNFIVGEVMVSDMDFTVSRKDYVNPYRDTKVMSPLMPKNKGKEYPKGLGMHANCFIEVPLNGNYTRFTSIVGIDDRVEGGSVSYEVYDENDVALYIGQTIEGKGTSNTPSEYEEIDIDVTGVQTLKLHMTDGKMNGITGDHGNWTMPTLTLKDGLAVEDNDYSKSISVYPNPTSGSLRISIPSRTKAIVNIMDMSGQIVKEFQLSCSSTQIDLSELPLGIYNAIIKSENNVAVKKIVISK
jgi:hypothetical protein